MSYSANDFYIGQRVRFRQWDEMEAEFGLDCDGDINVHLGFSPDLRHLCGTTATIKSIGGLVRNSVYLVDYDDINFGTGWVFSCSVIEPVESKEEFSEEEFLSLIGG